MQDICHMQNVYLRKFSFNYIGGIILSFKPKSFYRGHGLFKRLLEMLASLHLLTCTYFVLNCI